MPLGRDLVTRLQRLPKSVDVTSEEMMDALEEPLHTICEAVHNVLERTPPELSADHQQFRRIMLTGGGALLCGIDKRIEGQDRHQGADRRRPEVVRGGRHRQGAYPNNLDALETNALNRRAPYL